MHRGHAARGDLAVERIPPYEPLVRSTGFLIHGASSATPERSPEERYIERQVAGNAVVAKLPRAALLSSSLCGLRRAPRASARASANPPPDLGQDLRVEELGRGSLEPPEPPAV